MGTIFAARSRWERRRIAKRIQQGLAQRAREGLLVGPLPIGYERSDGVVQPSTDAAFVRDAFERYATGSESLRSMAAWAHQQGRSLDRLGIRKLLINRTYTGVVVWHGRGADREIYSGQHPPIIDGALFVAVQTRLGSRRRGGSAKPWGRQPYPLSGIAHCSHCGSALVGSRGGTPLRRYMRCGRAQRLGRHACEQRMVPAEGLEAQVGAYLKAMVLPDQWPGATVQQLNAAAQTTDRPAEYQRAAAAYVQLRSVGEIPNAEYERRMERLEARFSPTADVVVDTEKALALMRDVPHLWASTDDAGRRALTVALFERMRVQGNWVAGLTPQAKYAPLFVHDRTVRLGGEMNSCSLAPRAGLEPTT